MAKKTKDSNLSLEERLEQALIPNWDEPYKLPPNWCWTKFDIVAKWGSGGTPSRKNPEYYVGNIPWVKTGELNNSFIYETEEHISEKAVSNSSAKLFPINTVIVAMYGATIGKVGILGLEATTNQACACGVCSSAVDYKYLFYYSISQKDDFISKGKGGAQPNISQEIIKQHEIPLPPFAEQQRIVARIEFLFAKLDEAKEKAQEVVDEFETRKAAIFHKAFSGELTAKWREEHDADQNWKKCCLSDIGVIITGSTPDTKNVNFYGGTIPFIKPTELNQGRNVVYSSETLTEEGKKVSRPIRAGATCICCIGATIGKCGFLRVDAVTNQQINSIVPYDFMCDEFVYYYCNSNDFKNELIKNSSSTTLPIINKKKTEKLPIVIPSKDEQIEIASIIDGLIIKEQNAKEIAEAVIDQIDTMKKAILARAFRGELGTNDPSEESAVELLRKIIGEK